MTKKELLAVLKEKLAEQEIKLSLDEVRVVLDTALETIGEHVLEGGEKITTVLGTFKLAKTKAREGRNPLTGQTMLFPNTKRVAFTASAKFKAKEA